MREIGLWGTPESVAKITFKGSRKYTVDEVRQLVADGRLEHVGGDDGNPLVIRYVVVENGSDHWSELRLTEPQL